MSPQEENVAHVTVPKCILDPTRDCLGLQKAQMLEKQIDKYMSDAHGTHSEIFGRLISLEKSEAARNEQYNSIIEKLNTLQVDLTNALAKISELQAKPGKRWDSIVDKAIWFFIAAMLGYIALNIGLPVG